MIFFIIGIKKPSGLWLINHLEKNNNNNKNANIPKKLWQRNYSILANITIWTNLNSLSYRMDVSWIWMYVLRCCPARYILLGHILSDIPYLYRSNTCQILGVAWVPFLWHVQCRHGLLSLWPHTPLLLCHCGLSESLSCKLSFPCSYLLYQ